MNKDYFAKWMQAINDDLAMLFGKSKRMEWAIIFLFMSNIGLMISLFMMAWKIK